MKALYTQFCVIALIFICAINQAQAGEKSTVSDFEIFSDQYDPLADENLDYTFKTMACPTTTVTANANATVTVSGNNILANDDCTLRTARDYVIQVNIPECGDWRFSACQNGGTTDYDVYFFLGTTCCGSEVGSNDDGCGCGPSELVVNDIQAGTYFLAVEAFNNTSSCGFPDNLGNFTVAIDKVGTHPDLPTAEPFGNNAWTVYGYYGNNYDVLAGSFDAGSALNQNSTTQFPSAGSPSDAPTWTGCTIPVNNHSFRYKRRGFPCGVYRIDIGGHDDNAYLEIDGTTEWFHNGCCDPHPGVWTGILDANSEVLFGVREFSGGSNLDFSVVDIGTALNAGSHNTTALTGCVGYNPGNINANAASGGTTSAAVTGGTTTYQWQSNGVDIAGATGEDYNPPAFNTIGTYDIRREVTDFCGDVAYTNAKTYTIVADPTISMNAAPTDVCPGNTSVLTATTSGGTGTCTFTWQSSPDDATWTTLASGVTNTTFEVYPTADTYYRVRRVCTGGGCNDPYSASILITATDNTNPTFNNCPMNISQTNDVGLCSAVVTWTEPTVSDDCLPNNFNAGGFSFSSLGQYEDHMYFVSDSPLVPASGSDADQASAFANAQAIAASVGGYLVTIDNMEENDFINGVTGGFNVLIGYTDELVEGSFGWIGGGGTGFTNWNGGEPNNAGGEDYVEIQDGVGGWNDIDLGLSQRRFVIEINVMSSTHEPGDVFPVGTTTVTYTATDGSGNTSTCSFDVTVTDDEDPTITCPADINFDIAPGVCEAVINYATPTTTDNCPAETLVQTAGLPSGAIFPVGTTTNTFEVTDASGNMVSCSFDVVVTFGGGLVFEFNNPLTTACAGDAPYTNLTGGSPTIASLPGDSGVYTGVGVTDNGNGSFDFDPSIAGAGNTNIMYTYNDGAGCSYSIIETITIYESPIASISCPDPIIKDCQGPFNCNPTDLNPTTLPIASGSVSGSAAAYVYGDATPGAGGLFIDLPNAPTDTPLELIYTITTTDGCTSTASCTFEIQGKNANAGRY